MILHLLNVLTAYRPNRFSKRLKKETKEIHDKIEGHPFFIDLLSGNLPDFKYAIYLQNLLPIYRFVEMFFFPKSFNYDLVRSRSVVNDLQRYIRDLNIDISKHNYNQEWINCFFSKSNFLRKTDLYVRWLADMYGGQFLLKKVKYGEKYRFTNLRQSIKTVRGIIEDGIDDSNIESFIRETNRTYKFHSDILDKIYALSEDSL